MSGRPEAENLINIYAALIRHDAGQGALRKFGGQAVLDFKNALADLTVAKIAPIADEMRRLLGDTAEIDRILRDGAARARAIAAPIMEDVKRVVGFVV